MSEDDNQLTVECQRAGVYELHLSWRPLMPPEAEQVSGQPTQAKPESEQGDFSLGEISAAPEKTATHLPKTTANASEGFNLRHRSSQTPTEAVKMCEEAKDPSAHNKPPPVGRCRPLHTLEVYEVAPVTGWIPRYRGAGTEYCLTRLKPNVSHRVRVRSDAGVSQVYSFSSLPAPVSVSELHRAVMLDRVARVETILAQRPRAVNAASAYGLSALMVAAREGFRQMTALLLRRGADVNQHSEGAGKTALMFASFAGQLEIADQLLAAGAAVGAQDRSGRAALHHAADGDSTSLVRRLVAAGAPLEQSDSEGWTPLMRAVMLGGPVSTLVELGARTDGSDRRGRQLRRMSRSPLRAAELLSVWRRSALVLPPWRRSSTQLPGG